MLYISPFTISSTFQTILNAVCIKTGMNAHVFNALRHTLQTVSLGDCVCCLTFYKMSIRENLHFNQ